MCAHLDGSQVDFGDGDKLDEFFDLYWDFVDPMGGMIIVHSTLTNEMSRAWLSKMTELSARSKEQADDKWGIFDVMSILEPHKMCQNSCTFIRRRGFGSDTYTEPIYTKYA